MHHVLNVRSRQSNWRGIAAARCPIIHKTTVNNNEYYNEPQHCPCCHSWPFIEKTIRSETENHRRKGTWFCAKSAQKCFPSRPAQSTARSLSEQLAPKLTDGYKGITTFPFSYIAACLFCFLQILMQSSFLYCRKCGARQVCRVLELLPHTGCLP